MPAKPSGTSSLFSGLITLAILAAAVAGLRNALAAEPALETTALDVACASTSAPVVAAAVKPPAATPARPAAAPPVKSPPRPPCRLQMTRWESSPVGRTFELESGTTRVRVRCMREYVLFGEYVCEKTR